MMNGDEGGQLSDFIGGDTVLMRGDIRLIGGIPPSPPPLGKTLECLIKLSQYFGNLAKTVTRSHNKTFFGKIFKTLAEFNKVFNFETFVIYVLQKFN